VPFALPKSAKHGDGVFQIFLESLRLFLSEEGVEVEAEGGVVDLIGLQEQGLLVLEEGVDLVAEKHSQRLLVHNGNPNSSFTEVLLSVLRSADHAPLLV
jgi:hypothetical protein